MIAYEIVAAVRANPPGGDVAVSPAVRTLVEEIVRLQGMLRAPEGDTLAYYLQREISDLQERNALHEVIVKMQEEMTTLKPMVVSLCHQLKHFGELSEADHNQLRERAEHLCLVIRTAKDELESNDEVGAYLTLKNSGVGDVE